jgi:iron complex outermembrane receptor protein
MPRAFPGLAAGRPDALSYRQATSRLRQGPNRAHRLRPLALLVIVGFVVAAGAARSQAPADTARDGIVVTASRFSDSLRDLPVGVTVITADDIRRSATSSLPEILAQRGLVHIRDNAGTPNQQIDLRGFGITSDQNTLVLVDGVRLSENEQVSAQLSSIPLDSIDRIEILRGSGAVLYGGGATAGTVNIITRSPLSGESRGRASARTGGFGTRELRASYERRGDSLGVSLVYSDESTGGYRSNNRFDQTNLTLGLDARDDGRAAYARIGFEDQKLRLPGALTEAQMQAERRQTLNANDWSSRTGGNALLGGSMITAWGEVAVDVSHRGKHAQAFFSPAFFVDTEAAQTSVSPRARINFEAWQRGHDMTVGVDWQEWNYTSRSAASQATLSAPFSHRIGAQSTAAFYALANLWVGEMTRVVAGGRLQRTREKLSEQVFPLDERRTARNLQAHELALRHTIASGFSGYAKYARSFRLANFDDNACFFPPCAANLLEPQTAQAVEAGVDWERGAWRLRASAYEMFLRNEIYFSPLTFSNINLSPTLRRGIEAEADWRATSEVDMHAGLAWQQARFRSGVYAGIDVSGKDVPLVPEFIASLSASWRFAPASRVSANLRYVGEQRYDNDQANTFGRKQPDYVIVDAKLEHRVDRVDLALEIKNLLNRKYYSYGVWNFATSFSAFPAPERAVYVTAGVRFD